MRLTAIAIGVFVLLLAGSCSIVPSSSFNGRAELNKLKGPDPGSIEGTLKAQADEAVNAGDFKQAMETYKQLVDKYPDKLEYKADMADCIRRSGDNDGALKLTDEILKKDPQNVGALETKGLSLMATGEFTEAGKAFGDVMKIDPKRWRTLDAIGILFAIKNMPTESQAYYEEALNQSTDNPSVLNNMGLTLAMDRQYPKAIESLQRAKRHLPAGNPEIRNVDLNLALVYAIAGKLDDAEQTAAPHLSKAGLYNNMGYYAYLAKNTDLARSYLNMALTQSPVYYERAWKNLGAINGDASSEANEDADMPKQNLHKLSMPTLPKPEKKTDDAAKKEDGKDKSAKDKIAKDDKDKAVVDKAAPDDKDKAAKDKDGSVTKDMKDAKDAAVDAKLGPSASGDSPASSTPVVGVPLDEIPESKPKAD